MAQPQEQIQFVAPPGAPPLTPEQVEQMRQQLVAQAQKAGMSVPEFIQKMRQQQMMQQQMQQQMAQQMRQQQQQQGGQPNGGGPPQQQGPPHQHGPPMQQRQMPISDGPPNPVAIAMADFLRGQQLKHRVSIFNGERREMFRVKRAIRALESPAYEKARKKNPALPPVTDRVSAENAFKLLPMSRLAIRVSKIDPHEGHDHPPKKTKRVKGQWTVKIEPQQEAKDDMYYIWFYEGSKLKNKLYAAVALVLVFAVVLYPLWPLFMRQGVYYLSWAFLGFLGLFFLMAIFRVILFCVTYFIIPPGLWLFPNLWEDVSVVESFKPFWAWHSTEKPKKKKKREQRTMPAEAAAGFSGTTGAAPPATATTTATTTQIQTMQPTQRSYAAPNVEEVADDE